MLYENKDIRSLFLGDSHTRDFKCDGFTPMPISAAKYVESQVANTTEPVDIFLEIPYVFQKGGTSIMVGGYMGDLYENMYECFIAHRRRWCQYPNVRTHYVDLRQEDLSPYFQFERYIVSIFFDGKARKPMTYDSKHDIYFTLTERTRYLNDTFLKNIFKTKVSLVFFFKRLLKHGKIGKQLKYVKDSRVRKVIKKHIKEWLNTCKDDQNINFNMMTWKYISDVLKNLSTDVERNKELVKRLYYSLASYSGIVMDAYTIARMFRTYTDTPGKYSGPAKNIIVYAGSQHTHRYMRVFDDLGIPRVKTSFCGFSAGKLDWCTDMKGFPNPLFP